ncbi:MAG: hypothetical protein ACRC62_38390, partial [Microcoleus sp.]
ARGCEAEKRYNPHHASCYLSFEWFGNMERFAMKKPPLAEWRSRKWRVFDTLSSKETEILEESRI